MSRAQSFVDNPGTGVPATAGSGFTADETAAMTAALSAALGGVRGANPLVGAAVLAPDGTVVTGHHRGAGTPHAEVDAILRARQDDVDLAHSTLLVTLEPCNHTGRTGPCTRLIIDSGIPRVVFAIPDPNPVAGGGAATLRDAGVTVREGLLAAAAHELNERWLSAAAQGRPFVTAKIAQTLDGFSAAADGTSQWITGTAARARAHEIRAEVSAILVGTGTALADNPRLTVRVEDDAARPNGQADAASPAATAGPTTSASATGAVHVARQPVPVVIGTRDIPAGSHLAANPQLLRYRPTAEAFAADQRRVCGLSSSPPGETTKDHTLGATTPGGAPDGFLLETLRDLRGHGHDHVLVEGGPGLVGSFLKAGLVDRLLVFTAPVLLGAGLPSVGLPGIGTLADGLRLRPDPAAAAESLGPDRLDHFVPAAPTGGASSPGSPDL